MAADDDPIKLREVAIGGVGNCYPLAPAADARIARAASGKAKPDSIDFNLSGNRPTMWATVPPDLQPMCKSSQPNVVNVPQPDAWPFEQTMRR
jgi:hypothetical protein